MKKQRAGSKYSGMPPSDQVAKTDQVQSHQDINDLQFCKQAHLPYPVKPRNTRQAGSGNCFVDGPLHQSEFAHQQWKVPGSHYRLVQNDRSQAYPENR